MVDDRQTLAQDSSQYQQSMHPEKIREHARLEKEAQQKYAADVIEYERLEAAAQQKYAADVIEYEKKLKEYNIQKAEEDKIVAAELEKADAILAKEKAHQDKLDDYDELIASLTTKAESWQPGDNVPYWKRRTPGRYDDYLWSKVSQAKSNKAFYEKYPDVTFPHGTGTWNRGGGSKISNYENEMTRQQQQRARSNELAAKSAVADARAARESYASNPAGFAATILNFGGTDKTKFSDKFEKRVAAIKPLPANPTPRLCSYAIRK